MTSPSIEIKQFIIQRASELGFSDVGFSRAEELKDQRKYVKEWLENNYHGSMLYMENNFEKRLDPRKLVENAQTVVSLTFNYFPTEVQNAESYQIAKYAYGQDYHTVLKDKLHGLINELTEKYGCNGRVFTDSAPVLEREWARRGGLGWIGKHSLLINPKKGSYFLIAEMILDVSLEPSEPFDKNMCGTCTKCMDACPTSAIVEPTVIDANKCISYWTIEHKGEFNETTPTSFQNQMFGCDICQDVCPWNSKASPHNEELFKPHPKLLSFSKEDWEGLSIEDYQSIFRKSAVKRTKQKGLERNINHIKLARPERITRTPQDNRACELIGGND